MLSTNFILLPMVIAGLGLLFSIVGAGFVKIKNDSGSVQGALNMGNWLSIVFTLIASYFVIMAILADGSFTIRGGEVFSKTGVFWAVFTGLVVGVIS